MHNQPTERELRAAIEEYAQARVIRSGCFTEDKAILAGNDKRQREAERVLNDLIERMRPPITARLTGG